MEWLGANSADTGNWETVVEYLDILLLEIFVTLSIFGCSEKTVTFPDIVMKYEWNYMHLLIIITFLMLRYAYNYNYIFNVEVVELCDNYLLMEGVLHIHWILELSDLKCPKLAGYQF